LDPFAEPTRRMRASSSGTVSVDRILVLSGAPGQESYDEEVEGQAREFHMLADGGT
jgi:hypothetical protein